MLKFIASLSLVLFLSSCSCDKDGAEFVGNIGPNQEKLVVLEPIDGWNFNAGEEFLIMLQAENFQLANPGDDSNPENGHYRVYLDGNDGESFFAKSGDENLVYQIPASLESGIHTLRFEVLDQSGTPNGAETVFSFRVN